MNNKDKENTVENRRAILKKYGAYTAPAIIALLMPSGSNAAAGTFSSVTSCFDGHMGNDAQNTSHCSRSHMLP